MERFFSEHQRQDILKLLAAILHLGNIYFEGERSQTHPGILDNEFNGVYLTWQQATRRITWKPVTSANPNTSAPRRRC